MTTMEEPTQTITRLSIIKRINPVNDYLSSIVDPARRKALDYKVYNRLIRDSFMHPTLDRSTG